MSRIAVEGTPVQRAEHVSAAVGREVWVKRDDLTHPRYGGNKVRKLARILDDAARRGATDLVTLGAVGSHHALATTIHGGAAGFRVHAVVLPQPATPHAEETARAVLSQGGTLWPARGAWEVPLVLARAMLRLRAQGRRGYFIPLGGSNSLGAAGYVDAARELRAQLDRGEIPGAPDVVLCPLGSGGTYAGLLAGARAHGLPSAVVGVLVTPPWMVSRAVIAGLARRALRCAEPECAAAHPRIRPRDVVVERGHAGAGYGHPTAAGERARELFARDGIVLDPTYTAKTAAALVDLARRGPPRRTYLLWHTLSSAPMAPLLAPGVDLPDDVRALLRP